VLLLAEMLFPERKRESRTRPEAASAAQPVLPTAATLLLLLLVPAVLQASPGSALREYKAGQYEQALKEYEELLKRKGDDPRLHFNAGAAAYRDRQFEEAAKHFNATLASPDLQLQGRAYYNEGNALYHLGENNPDPKKRTEAWEKALADYQSTVKLNPQDADAKFNYDFVKQRLEKLKQQQQQQQQNKDDQQKNQDQQQQQQNQQQQDQQNKDPQQQQAQQKQQDQQKQQQEQAAQQSQEQKDQQQQAQQSAGQPKEKGDENEEQAAAAQVEGQMTPQQARQLLDTQKGEEQMLPVQPTGKPADSSRPIKDW
jgi:Ca-activated chloride channel homolog